MIETVRAYFAIGGPLHREIYHSRAGTWLRNHTPPAIVRWFNA